MGLFDAEYRKVAAKEGGYSDHPSDRGGPTNHGITEQVARAYGYQGHMRDLSAEQARAIYKRRYWDLIWLDDIGGLSPDLAAEMFDTGVNMGTGTAVKFLQRALNVLNQRGRAYPDVSVDGGMGPMTFAALKEFLNVRGADGERALVAALNGLQAARYIEIAESDERQEDFAYGWLLQRVAS